MKVGRFFQNDDTVDHLFYYKDIYLHDKSKGINRDISINRYPFKLIIDDEEIIFVNNKVIARNNPCYCESEGSAKNIDKHLLHISPQQTRIFSIPYLKNKVKVADKKILNIYSKKVIFDAIIYFKYDDEKDINVDNSFLKIEIYDEGHNAFYDIEENEHRKHVFINSKNKFFGVKKMYKQNKPNPENKEVILKIPFKRFFLEFLYDYHFSQLFQDTLPAEKVRLLDDFFHSSAVIKGISLKFKVIYLKKIVLEVQKIKNYNQKKNYWISEYRKLLNTWREFVISDEFNNLSDVYYGKKAWFNNPEAELETIHNELLYLINS